MMKTGFRSEAGAFEGVEMNRSEAAVPKGLPRGKGGVEDRSEFEEFEATRSDAAVPKGIPRGNLDNELGNVSQQARRANGVTDPAIQVSVPDVARGWQRGGVEHRGPSD